MATGDFAGESRWSRDSDGSRSCSSGLSGLNKIIRFSRDSRLPPAAAYLRQLETSLLQKRLEATGVKPSEGLQQSRQRTWDRASATAVASQLLEASSDDTDRARLRTAAQPQSGAWLNALPVASLGTLLDRETLRTAVALRVGAPVCTPHRCRCGATIDARGLHVLSCQLSAGRHPRHAALNDTVKRALQSAGMPSVLEPAGLDQRDGKRPDGMTTFPFTQGKCLIWDSTCVDTYANSIIQKSAAQAGAAAQAAESRKQRRYAELGQRFKFVAVAVETSGCFGSSTVPFLRDLGLRIARETGDKRESDFLFQRISLAVVRGNATSLLMGSAATVAPRTSSNGLRSSEPTIRPAQEENENCPLDTGRTPTSPRAKSAPPTHKSAVQSGMIPAPSSSVSSLHRPRLEKPRDAVSDKGVRSASRSPGLLGMKNTRNTCYVNSILQCLCNTQPLHDYILRGDYCSDINTSTSIAKGALIKALSTLMRDLWKDSGETEHALNTAPLKLELQRRAPLFRGHQQQDAQEFLLHLLEGLHDDVNRVTSRTQTATADIEDSLSDMQMAMMAMLLAER